MAVRAPPDHTVFLKFFQILEQFISIAREYEEIFDHIKPNKLNLTKLSEHDLMRQRDFHFIPTTRIWGKEARYLYP